jgi:16S rRNA processing protein RimM
MSSSRSSRTPTEGRVAVARVLGAKGLRGGLRVELLTDWPERLVAGLELFVDDAEEPARIRDVERGGRSTVLHLEGVTTREDAEALAGRYLEAVAQPLPADSWYWDDLVGLSVVEPDGREVGELVEVFRAGGGEVYRVVGPRGERLVPALRAVVLDIDREANQMIVAPDDAEEVV